MFLCILFFVFSGGILTLLFVVVFVDVVLFSHIFCFLLLFVSSYYLFIIHIYIYVFLFLYSLSSHSISSPKVYQEASPRHLH